MENKISSGELADEDMGFFDKLNLDEGITEKSANLARDKKYPEKRMPERTDYPTKKDKK